jgi:hypothetical protein
VVFTSIRDDAWWGDTDGTTTGAAAGDWERLEITGTGNPSSIRGAIFRFGGGGNLGQVFVNGTGASAAPNVAIANSHLYLGLATGGVRTTNANARLDSCSFFGPSSRQGVTNTTDAITVTAENCWWGAASGPFDTSLVDPCTNPTGLGAGVSDYVDYCAWLGTGAPVTDAPDDRRDPGVGHGIVHFGPSPTSGSVKFVVGRNPGEPVDLSIVDIHGRRIWKQESPPGTGPRVLIEWNGANENGVRVPPGVYWARIRVGAATTSRAVVIRR